MEMQDARWSWGDKKDGWLRSERRRKVTVTVTELRSFRAGGSLLRVLAACFGAMSGHTCLDS
jgi:hypothetical protein